MPITDLFPGLQEVAAADGMPTVYVDAGALPEAALALRNGGFSVMLDAIPVDLHPREPRFEISYLLLNPGDAGSGAARLRLKVKVPGTDPRLPTLSHVWPSVNWAEREAFDLFGILFDGHPDLRRILMPEDWEGFPMRKDYPVQIKTPVKTYEPLQLSEEEFVANIEAAREHGQRD
ncbi:MAG TPA: NADH-quinone oxidoreductase subunit C [Vicinamibacterales bacterium]|nr:NADH-quinone oxidoreductase subunit C [Vicinamibacterales bacterium]